MNEHKDVAAVFEDIFENNAWKSKSSISGRGSSLKATQRIRAKLPALLETYSIKTLVDAPCGDLKWMQHLEYAFDKYIGVDIVPELVRQMKVAFPDREFMVGNIAADVLPQADAILCRDCLVHLPLDMGVKAIDNFRKAGFTYALLTTFPGHSNVDIKAGSWRPLDMTKAPFNLHEPLDLLRERAENPEDRYESKRLGLWKL